MTLSEPMSDENIKHSDFIVYVDESGDHSLESINPEYPLFVLSFCIFHKSTYNEVVAPALRGLKFSTFGHDMVVLHEHEIRNHRLKDFSKFSKEQREAFINKLTDIISFSDFQLVAVVIDKWRLKERYLKPTHPYHLALEFGLERIYRLLQLYGQTNALTHIVCEARGAKEDKELELEFRRIREQNHFNTQLPFDLIIADKKTNSEGLQLADLTARPIGLSVLRPEQKNRAFTVLEKKFYRDDTGNKMGIGLKVFP